MKQLAIAVAAGLVTLLVAMLYWRRRDAVLVFGKAVSDEATLDNS